MPRTPSIATVYGKRQDRYLELVRRFPLRPIRSEEELDDAIRVIDMLVDQEKRSDAEEDYLDVLGDLIEAYEDVHHPMDEPSDGDMLRFLIEQKGVTQAAVARDAGLAASTVSEVLAGKRTLTRAQIGKLAKFFKVEPGVFRFDG
jgi:HTH-type transcriptional regulator / antitoxin HigA